MFSGKYIALKKIGSIKYVNMRNNYKIIVFECYCLTMQETPNKENKQGGTNYQQMQERSHMGKEIMA